MRDNSGLDHRYSFDDGFISPSQPPLFSDQLKSFVLSYDFRDLPGLEHISGGVDIGQLHAQPGHGETANTISARLHYDAPLSNGWNIGWRSEEHTSELQSLMSISYAGFGLKNKKHKLNIST